MTNSELNLADAQREHTGRVVDGLLEALRRRDMKAFADAWAPDGTMEFPFAPPGYPRLTSRGQVWDYLHDYTDKIQLHEVTERARHYSIDPRTVVLEFSVVGTVVATGAAYRMSYVSVITVGTEGIESYRDHWNSMALAVAAGAVESFAAAYSQEDTADD